MFRNVLRAGLLLCTLLFGRAAIAGPVRCSYGDQDSSCRSPISAPWQTPPSCPTAAGWTTTSPAQWIGSRYTSPSCNFQAPPSCPSGQVQTSAPQWTGAAWTGPGCLPASYSPPPVTPADEALACTQAFANGLYRLGGINFSGPYTGRGMAQYNAMIVAAEQPYQDFVPFMGSNSPWFLGSPGTPAINDLFVAPYYAFCWVQPGTTNVTGMAFIHWCGPNGGTADCGGGGVGN